MGKIVKKIYEEIVRNEADAIKLNSTMDDEIKHIMESVIHKGSELEMEELQNLFFDVALSAQRKGFLLGMRYAVKILAEILES